MRVVGGSAKGTKLLLVPGRGTRPILDRVKTALFDILRPRIAGSEVLDLFAGSGSVGIEALSQGAARCTFIDRAHQAIATIKRNLARAALADRAVVEHADAFAYLNRSNGSFDLVFIAPPQYQDLWVEVMRQLDGRPEILRRAQARSEDERAAALAIVQIDPREYQPLHLRALHEIRQKRYGNTLLLFFALRPELD
jgi:16S rRNA (guanine(966)-N(2))-methyltransferase RsmD